MLKTILEIELNRSDFDKLFPDDLCVKRNDIRLHEQFWGYSYSSSGDKTAQLYGILENTKDFKYRNQLSVDLSMYENIVRGHGKTPFVNFVERL